MAENSFYRVETLWENDKLLVMSVFLLFPQKAVACLGKD